MSNPPADNSTYHSRFVGLDAHVPTLNGSSRRYINFDNAASTPSFLAAQDAVNQFLAYYSSVHRGTGFKSQLSTHLFDRARQIAMDFVGADPETHVCMFGKNTTEALNKLAHRFPFQKGRDVVLTSGLEHHSNDLPWRGAARAVHIGLTPEGALDEADFDAKLEEYAGQVVLVALSGASNVTGVLPPIHRLAEKSHAAGAQIAVDCAQLAPHRPVAMGPLDDPGHLDYVALSAHKMYAPYGSGLLVGRRDTFERGVPEYSGGGTIEIVTLDEVVWAEPPERDEAGSPNTVGVIAMAAAMRELQSIGLDAVAAHEADLTAYALARLAQVPGLQLYGDTRPAWSGQRLGVIPFNLDGLSHFLVAAILGYEYGIGVRNGCFCAHPYILHLLGLPPSETRRVRDDILNGDRHAMPGLVRVSFGLYNTRDEVDTLVAALHQIVRGEYHGTYRQDRHSGEYHPEGWAPAFERYLSL